MFRFDKAISLATAIAASCLLIPCIGNAQSVTTKGTITYVENGWYGEGIVVKLTGTTAFPCATAPNNEFAVKSTHTAYKEIYSMLLSAYMAKIPVSFVVQNSTCALGARTNILSVRY